MKKLLSVAVVSAGFFAQAHEVGLLIDKQFGESQTGMIVVNGVLVSSKVDAVKPTGFGIRGAYTVLNLKVLELGISATYHPSAKDDLKISGTKIADFKNEYMALGAQLDWKFLVNLHAGVEVRREKQNVDWLTGGSDSATQTRPWVTAGIGFSAPMPIVSPFVRLEVAYATTNSNLPNTYSGSDFSKALAPKYQIGLYGGVRF